MMINMPKSSSRHCSEMNLVNELFPDWIISYLNGFDRKHFAGLPLEVQPPFAASSAGCSCCSPASPTGRPERRKQTWPEIFSGCRDFPASPEPWTCSAGSWSCPSWRGGSSSLYRIVVSKTGSVVHSRVSSKRAGFFLVKMDLPRFQVW